LAGEVRLRLRRTWFDLKGHWTGSPATAKVFDVATEDDVRTIALELPGVTERLSWGRPAWFTRTLMARMWDDDVLTVKTRERDVLAAAEPETYYWTSHHDRSPLLVLVRLDRIDGVELEELLRDSHRIAGG
jgi:hypothetical protein